MGRTSALRYALTEPLEIEETTDVWFEIEHVCTRPRVEIDRRTALPAEALFECRDAMETTIPFAHQDGAGFDAPPIGRAVATRLSAEVRATRAEAFERPAEGVGKIPQRIRLEPIGENARQKGLRQIEGSGPAKDVSPLQAKAGQIKHCEIGDRLSKLRPLDRSPRQRGQTLAGATR
jgi:hypothetical protein